MQGLELVQVDFVPDWYKQDLRARASLKRQYVALAVLFLAMVIWNGFSMQSISVASVELSAGQSSMTAVMKTTAQFDWLVRQIAEHRHELQGFQTISNTPNPAALLAELSVIIDHGIVVQDLQFANRADGPQLTMEGLAMDAESLASLIRGMQGSPYLSDVRLVYSRQQEQLYTLKFQVSCRAVVCWPSRQEGSDG